MGRESDDRYLTFSEAKELLQLIGGKEFGKELKRDRAMSQTITNKKIVGGESVSPWQSQWSFDPRAVSLVAPPHSRSKNKKRTARPQLGKNINSRILFWAWGMLSFSFILIALISFSLFW